MNVHIPPIRSNPFTVPRATSVQRTTNEKKENPPEKKKRPQDRSLKKR
ncbi:hypothetical protein [Anoxybacillus flavithermus]|nr:hypothetical protein [Anoxybacillus flavithermus]MBE2906364.1 hypothetical protein [Anoxybacillus flavithermus]MBE2906868.1 hypothetical protein [Anoxybacillus flavithermus]MBE2909704.1 hypothetical protein [Anoxybacillus flavithermus]MBE2916616.1 hypothetical protein [Anoxybacillus flavithermus]MBE2919396.1 hypothetical protein [Anoxybacillus flavithermus]